MKYLRKWFKEWLWSLLDGERVEIKVSPSGEAISQLGTQLLQGLIPNTHKAVGIAFKSYSESHMKSITDAIAAIPAPVVNVPDAVAEVDADKLSGLLSDQLKAVARDMLGEALRPPSKTLEDATLLDPPPDPSAEAAMLSKLPTDVQYAVRYACRKVQSENPSTSQRTTLGNNWHRNEACEWTKTWLRERGLKAHDTDINLACELYYRVYIRPGKASQQ